MQRPTLLAVAFVLLLPTAAWAASHGKGYSKGHCKGKPDGTPCNDGNACTQTDTCEAGVCSGSHPVACTALDQCHDAGVCNPKTGTCSNPPKANGTVCDDGNACTGSDTCNWGTCVGGPPPNCGDGNPCTDDSCSTSTGCVHANNTASCNDGSACTHDDMCQNGTCAGNPVVCTALDQCHDAGTCDPLTGICSNPPKPSPNPCDTCKLTVVGLTLPPPGAEPGAASVSGGGLTDCDPYSSPSGCSADVPCGTTVTLTAAVSEAGGLKFAGFWGCSTIPTCTFVQSCTLTVSAPKTVFASFWSKSWEYPLADSELCLSCHDGRADVPDVYGASSSSYVRAAGALNRVGDTGAYASSNGHSLGSTEQAPGGTWSPISFTCTDCHDAEGDEWYRNLRPDRGGDAPVFVSRATGEVWPASRMVVEAAGSPIETRYDTSNIRYGVDGEMTLADWCAGCHLSVHGAPGSPIMGGSAAGDSPSVSGDEWLRHPTGGITMGAAQATGRVDATHWWQTAGPGAPQSRVPVVSASGIVPADDNQPFCGTCHKTHGSGYKGGLLLDDDQTTAKEDGSKPLDTCQQCHFPASGLYAETRHGDVTAGANRDPVLPIGDCAQCHVQHGPSGSGTPYLLFAPNTNGMCATASCHVGNSTNSIYQALASYDTSSHGTSALVLWPGPTPPARLGGDAQKCVNCHTPHGRADAGGLIPALAVAREEALCAACHDGSSSLTNVMASFAESYAHPISIAGVHSDGEGSDPTAFGAGFPSHRHAECIDCHNPHVATNATYPPGTDGVLPASGRLAGVSGVRAGAAPAGQPRPSTYVAADATSDHPSQTGIGTEYGLCYKCHSSWTTLPLGSEDVALSFNPVNPSYHPVEARGTNPTVSGGAFVRPWAASSTVRCTDCHGDSSGATGPHGSSNAGLLKAPYDPGSGSGGQSMGPEELCFLCHAHGTYADIAAPVSARGHSRFNEPAYSGGHTFHVAQMGVRCGACHATHGATWWSHLFYPSAGGSTGFQSYGETSSGGTCESSCHATSSYGINYAR